MVRDKVEAAEWKYSDVNEHWQPYDANSKGHMWNKDVKTEFFSKPVIVV